MSTHNFDFIKKVKSIFKNSFMNFIQSGEDNNSDYDKESTENTLNSLKNDYKVFTGFESEFENMEFSFKVSRSKYPVLKIIKKPKGNIEAKEIYTKFTVMYNSVSKILTKG